MYRLLLSLILITSVCQAQFVADKNLNAVCNRSHAPNLQIPTSQVTASYDVKYHRCEWNIDPVSNYISGSVTTYFVPTAFPISLIDFDFATVMTVDSVLYSGTTATFSQVNDIVRLICLHRFQLEFLIPCRYFMKDFQCRPGSDLLKWIITTTG